MVKTPHYPAGTVPDHNSGRVLTPYNLI